MKIVCLASLLAPAIGIKQATLAEKRLASLQATGCTRTEPLPAWWAKHFDPYVNKAPANEDPELRNMKGYCEYALKGSPTYNPEKLDICCGENQECPVTSCRRLTEFVTDANEFVPTMAEKRLATLQATGCPRKEPLPAWFVNHFKGQDGYKEMLNMNGYCKYALEGPTYDDSLGSNGIPKLDICCGDGKKCVVTKCEKQTKWSLTAQASVPMKGVDGTFVHDKKTNTWVPTTKTWEDMVTCPDLGLDDSCLTPKSKCNMRHNVDKTGKGPKYLFDAGEECCCGALPEVVDDECNPKECADWGCPKWCHCFTTYPSIMEVFEGANPSSANKAIRELCPSDNSDCICQEE